MTGARLLRSARLPVAVAVISLLVYAPTAATDVVSDDVHAAAAGAWVIASTGQPWTDEIDVESLGRDDLHTFNYETANGHEAIHRTPGVVALPLPATWLGRPTTDPSTFSYVPQAVTAALAASLTVLMLFLTLSQRLAARPAVAITLVFALGTPVWSVIANATWTHTVTVLGIIGTAWAAQRERWWLAGLFGGVAIWGRLHVAVIVAIVGLGVALSRRRPRIAVAVALPSLGLLGLASVWSHWMYGSWFPSGGYPSDGRVDSLVSTTGFADDLEGNLINQLGMWVAPDRGILVWTPILVLLFPAVVRTWRGLPDWSRFLAAGGLVYTLVQGQLNGFGGGDAFYGYRLGLELLACVTPLYAFAAANGMGRVARVLVGPVAAAQVAAISLGALNDAFFLPEAQAWTHNAFVTALARYPVVDVWLVLLVVVGAWIGHRWSASVIRNAA